MIRIHGHGVVYGEIWYDDPLPEEPQVDIVLYPQRNAPLPGLRYQPTLTLLTDLTVAVQSISTAFTADCRYKIRRADSKDQLCADFITSPHARLHEFRFAFDAFARQKSLPPCDQQWLLAACKAGQLVLSSASCNGETLVWHAYVIGGRVARVQYSASLFRNRENDYRALVGRANRWLHWKDMVSFKDNGIESYDWGGLFADETTPERAGINNFKRDFGGKPLRAYFCTVPLTCRGRLWLPLRDAWGRTKSVLDRRSAVFRLWRPSP